MKGPGDSLIAQLVKNPLVMQETLVQFLGQEDPLEKQWTTLPTPVFLGFPCGSAGKESASNVGDMRLVPDLGRSPGEGKGYPCQYSDLENSMNHIVHGDAKCRARLSNFHFHFIFCDISVINVLRFILANLDAQTIALFVYNSSMISFPNIYV